MFYQKLVNILFSLFLCTCGQDKTSEKENNNFRHEGNLPFEHKEILQMGDTSKIIILPIDTLGSLPFPDGTYSRLTTKEFKTLDGILRKCIYANNHSQDTTRHIFEYIDLDNYKRQYIPFIDGKGQKKVFVNCFCEGDLNLDNWKQEVILVDDGGSCFFHVTINLTTGTFEELFINGYA